MAKDAALENKWKQRVEEYRQSGLSIRDWCRKNKFKETTFKYWIYKFNNSEQNSSSANTDFAEVLLPSSNISNKVINESATAMFILSYESYSIGMSDETTWQVNKEKGKKASSKSYIWIHRSGSFEEIPIILYEYTRTRSGYHAKKFLAEFQGFHISDAYKGYEKIDGITRCLCFSHLRRYYLDAIPLDSGKKEISGSGGAIGRAYCDKLFKLERKP